jgi:hypothetical protein
MLALMALNSKLVSVMATAVKKFVLVELGKPP